MEMEPVKLSGILRTVSDLSALRLDVPDLGVVSLRTNNIPHAVITSLRVGMQVDVRAEVTEESSPAGEPKLIYDAVSVDVVEPPERVTE